MSLEDHGLRTGIRPAYGWHYKQTVAGRVERIPATGEARGGRALVEAVRLFRVNLALPLGDPEADVAAYIKHTSPHNDRTRGGSVGRPRVAPLKPLLIEDLRAWLDETATAHPTFVLQDEAVARAAVCQQCPQNVKWRVDGCGACNTEVDYRAHCLRRRVTFELDEPLQGCRLARIHLQAAVFLDRAFLPPRPPGAPGACWLPHEPNERPSETANGTGSAQPA